MKEYVKIPALFMRGGTSKGVYLDLADLPTDQGIRDQVILDIYGSPDARQINGMGGADPLTSKVALLDQSAREGIDVDYTFGYVGINDAHVDYEGNCGNISSGVGIYAILKGWVLPSAPLTKVRIYNTNTKKVIVAEIPTAENGEVITMGGYSIDGVAGSGARIDLDFLNSGGSKTGKLLPTGNLKDQITLSSGKVIEASLVDAANPAIFVRAEDIGLTGCELPSDCANHPEIVEILDDIRTTGAVLMGLAKSKEEAGPAVPKVAMVSSPKDHTCSDGRLIQAGECDLIARTLALGVLHKAYAVTGGICVATAALLPGTVVNDLVAERAKETGVVRLAHPSGLLDFAIGLEKQSDGKWHLEKAGVSRTARLIMEGQVFVTRSVYEGKR